MTHRFYAIQTTSGHENKVRSLIQRKIDADPAAPEARAIRQALVPTQEVVEIKNGKKVTVELVDEKAEWMKKGAYKKGEGDDGKPESTGQFNETKKLVKTN